MKRVGYLSCSLAVCGSGGGSGASTSGTTPTVEETPQKSTRNVTGNSSIIRNYSRSNHIQSRRHYSSETLFASGGNGGLANSSSNSEATGIAILTNSRSKSVEIASKGEEEESALLSIERRRLVIKLQCLLKDELDQYRQNERASEEPTFKTDVNTSSTINEAAESAERRNDHDDSKLPSKNHSNNMAAVGGQGSKRERQGAAAESLLHSMLRKTLLEKEAQRQIGGSSSNGRGEGEEDDAVSISSSTSLLGRREGEEGVRMEDQRSLNERKRRAKEGYANGGNDRDGAETIAAAGAAAAAFDMLLSSPTPYWSSEALVLCLAVQQLAVEQIGFDGSELSCLNACWRKGLGEGVMKTLVDMDMDMEARRGEEQRNSSTNVVPARRSGVRLSMASGRTNTWSQQAFTAVLELALAVVSKASLTAQFALTFARRAEALKLLEDVAAEAMWLMGTCLHLHDPPFLASTTSSQHREKASQSIGRKGSASFYEVRPYPPSPTNASTVLLAVHFCEAVAEALEATTDVRLRQLSRKTTEVGSSRVAAALTKPTAAASASSALRSLQLFRSYRHILDAADNETMLNHVSAILQGHAPSLPYFSMRRQVLVMTLELLSAAGLHTEVVELYANERSMSEGHKEATELSSHRRKQAAGAEPTTRENSNRLIGRSEIKSAALLSSASSPSPYSYPFSGSAMNMTEALVSRLVLDSFKIPAPVIKLVSLSAYHAGRYDISASLAYDAMGLTQKPKEKNVSNDKIHSDISVALVLSEESGAINTSNAFEDTVALSSAAILTARAHLVEQQLVAEAFSVPSPTDKAVRECKQHDSDVAVVTIFTQLARAEGLASYGGTLAAYTNTANAHQLSSVEWKGPSLLTAGLSDEALGAVASSASRLGLHRLAMHIWRHCCLRWDRPLAPPPSRSIASHSSLQNPLSVAVPSAVAVAALLAADAERALDVLHSREDQDLTLTDAGRLLRAPAPAIVAMHVLLRECPVLSRLLDAAHVRFDGPSALVYGRLQRLTIECLEWRGEAAESRRARLQRDLVTVADGIVSHDVLTRSFIVCGFVALGAVNEAVEWLSLKVREGKGVGAYSWLPQTEVSGCYSSGSGEAAIKSRAQALGAAEQLISYTAGKLLIQGAVQKELGQREKKCHIADETEKKREATASLLRTTVLLASLITSAGNNVPRSSSPPSTRIVDGTTAQSTLLIEDQLAGFGESTSDSSTSLLRALIESSPSSSSVIPWSDLAIVADFSHFLLLREGERDLPADRNHDDLGGDVWRAHDEAKTQILKFDDRAVVDGNTPCGVLLLHSLLCEHLLTTNGPQRSSTYSLLPHQKVVSDMISAILRTLLTAAMISSSSSSSPLSDGENSTTKENDPDSSKGQVAIAQTASAILCDVLLRSDERGKKTTIYTREKGGYTGPCLGRDVVEALLEFQMENRDQSLASKNNSQEQVQLKSIGDIEAGRLAAAATVSLLKAGDFRSVNEFMTRIQSTQPSFFEIDAERHIASPAMRFIVNSEEGSGITSTTSADDEGVAFVSLVSRAACFQLRSAAFLAANKKEEDSHRNLQDAAIETIARGLARAWKSSRNIKMKTQQANADAAEEILLVTCSFFSNHWVWKATDCVVARTSSNGNARYCGDCRENPVIARSLCWLAETVLSCLEPSSPSSQEVNAIGLGTFLLRTQAATSLFEAMVELLFSLAAHRQWGTAYGTCTPRDENGVSNTVALHARTLLEKVLDCWCQALLSTPTRHDNDSRKSESGDFNRAPSSSPEEALVARLLALQQGYYGASCTRNSAEERGQEKTNEMMREANKEPPHAAIPPIITDRYLSGGGVGGAFSDPAVTRFIWERLQHHARMHVRTSQAQTRRHDDDSRPYSSSPSRMKRRVSEFAKLTSSQGYADARGIGGSEIEGAGAFRAANRLRQVLDSVGGAMNNIHSPFPRFPTEITLIQKDLTKDEEGEDILAVFSTLSFSVFADAKISNKKTSGAPAALDALQCSPTSSSSPPPPAVVMAVAAFVHRIIGAHPDANGKANEEKEGFSFFTVARAIHESLLMAFAEKDLAAARTVFGKIIAETSVMVQKKERREKMLKIKKTNLTCVDSYSQTREHTFQEEGEGEEEGERMVKSCEWLSCPSLVRLFTAACYSTGTVSELARFHQLPLHYARIQSQAAQKDEDGEEPAGGATDLTSPLSSSSPVKMTIRVPTTRSMSILPDDTSVGERRLKNRNIHTEELSADTKSFKRDLDESRIITDVPEARSPQPYALRASLSAARVYLADAAVLSLLSTSITGLQRFDPLSGRLASLYAYHNHESSTTGLRHPRTASIVGELLSSSTASSSALLSTLPSRPFSLERWSAWGAYLRAAVVNSSGKLTNTAKTISPAATISLTSSPSRVISTSTIGSAIRLQVLYSNRRAEWARLGSEKHSSCNSSDQRFTWVDTADMYRGVETLFLDAATIIYGTNAATLCPSPVSRHFVLGPKPLTGAQFTASFLLALERAILTTWNTTCDGAGRHCGSNEKREGLMGKHYGKISSELVELWTLLEESDVLFFGSGGSTPTTVVGLDSVSSPSPSSSLCLPSESAAWRASCFVGAELLWAHLLERLPTVVDFHESKLEEECAQPRKRVLSSSSSSSSLPSIVKTESVGPFRDPLQPISQSATANKHGIIAEPSTATNATATAEGSSKDETRNVKEESSTTTSFTPTYPLGFLKPFSEWDREVVKLTRTTTTTSAQPFVSHQQKTPRGERNSGLDGSKRRAITLTPPFSIKAGEGPLAQLERLIAELDAAEEATQVSSKPVEGKEKEQNSLAFQVRNPFLSFFTHSSPQLDKDSAKMAADEGPAAECTSCLHFNARPLYLATVATLPPALTAAIIKSLRTDEEALTFFFRLAYRDTPQLIPTQPTLQSTSPLAASSSSLSFSSSRNKCEEWWFATDKELLESTPMWQPILTVSRSVLTSAAIVLLQRLRVTATATSSRSSSSSQFSTTLHLPSGHNGGYANACGGCGGVSYFDSNKRPYEVAIAVFRACARAPPNSLIKHISTVSQLEEEQKRKMKIKTRTSSEADLKDFKRMLLKEARRSAPTSLPMKLLVEVLRHLTSASPPQLCESFYKRYIADRYAFSEGVLPLLSLVKCGRDSGSEDIVLYAMEEYLRLAKGNCDEGAGRGQEEHNGEQKRPHRSQHLGKRNAAALDRVERSEARARLKMGMQRADTKTTASSPSAGRDDDQESSDKKENHIHFTSSFSADSLSSNAKAEFTRALNSIYRNNVVRIFNEEGEKLLCDECPQAGVDNAEDPKDKKHSNLMMTVNGKRFVRLIYEMRREGLIDPQYGRYLPRSDELVQ